MVYHEIRNWVRRKQILGLIVARTLKPGARDRNRESSFLYLLIFIPAPQLGPKAKITDYLLFRDRSGSRDKIRYFRGLFTVAKTIKTWEIDKFTFLDLTGAESELDAMNKILDVIRTSGGPYKPLKEWLEESAIFGA